MKCQYCNHLDSRVVDSRPTEDGSAIRRRRECANCGKRFTTYEKVEWTPLLVVKKDGAREVFRPEKIKEGVIRACHKRPVAVSDIDGIVSDIEQVAYNGLKQEITTRQIGEMVMERLRTLDEVAYIRYASVNRQFMDIPTFMKELTHLMKDKETD